MTIVLHLGVIDQPYGPKVSESQKRVAVRSGKQKARVIKRAPSGGESTGDVAEMLEDKYHVMELFVEELGSEAIENALAHSIEGVMENIAMGAPPNVTFAHEALGEIESAFRHFIDQKELDGIAPGVPTKAALKGVNHRLAHPNAKSNPERPSFRDTGLYEASFKAWTD